MTGELIALAGARLEQAAGEGDALRTLGLLLLAEGDLRAAIEWARADASVQLIESSRERPSAQDALPIGGVHSGGGVG